MRKFLCINLVILGVALVWRAAQAQTAAALPSVSSEAVSPIRSGAAEVAALPTLDEGSTLSDYLTYAALNNPGLQAAFERSNAALERIPQARSLPDPRFSYEVDARVGPQQQTFALEQMFPWFGVLRLRADQAAEEANAAHARYEAEKLKLFYMVKDAYYEHYYLQQAIDTVHAHLDLVKQFETIASAKYRTSMAGSGEVIRAQVELGKLDDSLRTLQDLRGPVIARLNAALNRRTDLDIPRPAAPRLELVSATDQELLARLSGSNPELREMSHELSGEQHAVSLARKQRYPDFSLGLSYMNSPDTAMSGSSADPVSLMFSINIPIWRSKYNAAEREATSQYLAVIAEKQDRENQLLSSAKMVLYQLRDAERKIDLYRNTLLPKAKQALATTEASYRSGSAGFLDLLDAERILLDFQLSYQRAFADHGQRLAELEMLVGAELPLAQAESSGTNVAQADKGGTD